MIIHKHNNMQQLVKIDFHYYVLTFFKLLHIVCEVYI